jgi:hypothetical protein
MSRKCFEFTFEQLVGKKCIPAVATAIVTLYTETMKSSKSQTQRPRSKVASLPPARKTSAERARGNKFTVQPSTLEPQHLTNEQIERAVESTIAARVVA